MRFGIVTFPGTTGAHDMAYALAKLGHETEFVRHDATELPDVGGVVLPCGYSYGDYIRPGALARSSAIIPAIAAAADGGMPVIGVGNGFQILTEAGILPGALVRNSGIDMVCATVPVLVEKSVCAWVDADEGTILELPIAHESGHYVADEETLAELREGGRIVLRYCEADGTRAEGGSALDGSTDDIAGICNEAGNVFGLMPCIERAVDSVTGSSEGARLIQGITVSKEVAR